MSVATLADDMETAESGRKATTTSSAEENSTPKGRKTNRNNTRINAQWTTDGTFTVDNTQKHTLAKEQPRTTTCKRHAKWRSCFVVVWLCLRSWAPTRVSSSDASTGCLRVNVVNDHTNHGSNATRTQKPLTTRPITSRWRAENAVPKKTMTINLVHDDSKSLHFCT